MYAVAPIVVTLTHTGSYSADQGSTVFYSLLTNTVSAGTISATTVFDLVTSYLVNIDASCTYLATPNRFTITPVTQTTSTFFF